MSESIWGTATPGTITSDTGTPRSFGVDFRALVPGTVSAVRWYVAGPPTTSDISVAIFDPAVSTTAPLATGTATPTGAGWLAANLTAPLTIQANRKYTAVAWVDLGAGGVQPDYGYTQGALSGSVLGPGGNVVAYANGGRFSNNTPTLTYPGSPGTFNFFVDVLFDASAPTNPPPPVPPVGELPDVEAFLQYWLSTQPDLAGIHVGTRLPNNWAGDSVAVRLYRTGGGINNRLPFLLDVARMDVDVFAPTKAQAADLMAVIRRLILHTLIWSNTTSLGAVVSNTTEYVGPQWFDEPDYPNAGRYLTQVSLDVRPTF